MLANLVQLNMGEVAERFKAAVLKTVDPQGSGGSNPSLSAISVVCARRPWRYVFVFDQPRPVANPGRATTARPFDGENVHRTFSTSPSHPWPGVRLFPAHPPISFHVYFLVESSYCFMNITEEIHPARC